MNTPFLPDTLSMLEAIPHPAMILDRHFRIRVMNRLMEAMTGYELRNVTGIHGELVVRSNVGNLRGQVYRSVLHEGVSQSLEGDVLTCYRRKIPVQYTVSPLADSSGKRHGLMVLAENMVQQVNAKGEVNERNGSTGLIGHSPEMQKVHDMIALMAQTDTSVLITGETGTGKDKIAEIVHRRSERGRFPFVKINCGAMPMGLLESELFGHVKGAFTGATRNKPGVFKLADRGTLFLTEIGDMPLPLQIKLLSVLDDRQFTPVGGEEICSVDVRIIAATNRPLRQDVRHRRFREDLFYRLNVLHLHLPPLRERGSDIPYLMDHFLQKFVQGLGREVVGFTPGAREALMEYRYPGNIRELSNIVEYAVNVCKRKKIGKEHLPSYLFEPSVEEVPGEMAFSDEVSLATAAGDGSGEKKWIDIERDMIIETLKSCGGNKTRASESLGWGRMKLWRKMKKYGLME